MTMAQPSVAKGYFRGRCSDNHNTTVVYKNATLSHFTAVSAATLPSEACQLHSYNFSNRSYTLPLHKMKKNISSLSTCPVCTWA